MSTKIYYAWRIPQERLNEFIDIIRPQIFKKAKEIVRNLMPAVKDEKIKEEKEKAPYLSEELIRFNATIELCRKISKGVERYPGIDIDFGLNIWLKDNYAYLVPIGESYFKCLELPEWVIDYSYWNNTDCPKEVSQNEWEERCATWEQINLGEGVYSHNARRLYHSIIDLSARYGDFDAEWTLQNMIVPKKRNVA